VDDMLFGKVAKPLVDIIYHLLDISFLKIASVCKHNGFQVALVTELGYYVAVVSAGNDIVAFEDIGMVQYAQYLDFRPQQVNQDCRF
jgi:hypothetical protein